MGLTWDVQAGKTRNFPRLGPRGADGWAERTVYVIEQVFVVLIFPGEVLAVPLGAQAISFSYRDKLAD